LVSRLGGSRLVLPPVEILRLVFLPHG